MQEDAIHDVDVVMDEFIHSDDYGVDSATDIIDSFRYQIMVEMYLC